MMELFSIFMAIFFVCFIIALLGLMSYSLAMIIDSSTSKDVDAWVFISLFVTLIFAFLALLFILLAIALAIE